VVNISLFLVREYTFFTDHFGPFLGCFGMFLAIFHQFSRCVSIFHHFWLGNLVLVLLASFDPLWEPKNGNFMTIFKHFGPFLGNFSPFF